MLDIWFSHSRATDGGYYRLNLSILGGAMRCGGSIKNKSLFCLIAGCRRSWWCVCNVKIVQQERARSVLVECGAYMRPHHQMFFCRIFYKRATAINCGYLWVKRRRIKCKSQSSLVLVSSHQDRKNKIESFFINKRHIIKDN